MGLEPAIFGLKSRIDINRGLSPRLITVGLFCALLPSCGGGGSSAPPPKPLTVTAKVLYSFGSTSTDAMQPDGLLIQGSDGNFYGTTYFGGLPDCNFGNAATDSSAYIGCGTVYKITPAGEETVLHLFTPGSGDGIYPASLIEGSDGNFYGTAVEGGANNLGAVFKLTPQGTETILYSFSDASDGAGPDGLVQGSDGNFYGTTEFGGVSGAGTVFRLTQQGVETVLYSFTGNFEEFASPPTASTDGANPVGQLVEGSDGNFYGVTSLGGLIISTTDEGEVTWGGTAFKVTPAGVETVLRRFSGAPDDGWLPNGGLIQGSDGTLYGTTQEGGINDLGTVFSITPTGIETILHSFDGSDGAASAAGLTQGTDGNFYGTTVIEGTNEGGTMFQLTPSGVLTVLYSFPQTFIGGYYGPGPDTNLVQGRDGNLYGATQYAGTYNLGYFFELVLSSH